MDSDFGSETSSRGRPTAAERVKAGAADAAEKLADLGQRVASQAGDTASSLGGEAQKLIKGALEDKVAAGAEVVSQVAAATKAAADRLEPEVPIVGELARLAAGRLDAFAASLKGRSADDLMRDARDLARERPALVFGAAAACGFALYRVATANAEPDQESRAGRTSRGP